MREEVNGVFEQAGTDVSVIALNRSQNPPAGSLNFALTPDEEGIAAADRLVNAGQRNVWVFSQRDDNSQRALAAFREQLRARGGDIVGATVLGEEAQDLSVKLAEQLAQSRVRPDAIFMAVKAVPSRALAVQLKLTPMSMLPRISSSLILNGGGNARLDADLDGIEFPEMPWLLGQSSGLPEPETLAKALPSARGPAQRLFAFGMDAWKLAAYLDRLGNDPGFMIRGATGTLRIDSFGTVQRDTAWAVFSGGRPRLAGNRSASTEPAPGR